MPRVRQEIVASAGVLISMPWKTGCSGLDLARALGVVVPGLGENFAGPLVPAVDDDAFECHAPSWRRRRKTPPPLGPHVLLGCWPVVESPLSCSFGA